MIDKTRQCSDEVKLAKFYIVPTPIGNLADMSLRAIEVLSSVNFICAEDTRESQKLLTKYAIQSHLISLHQHNEQQRVAEIIQRLQQGQTGAVISDAGTPLISDPGYRLITALIKAGISISPLPGPCALITALSASGLSPDQFLFLGFLPSQASKRLSELKNHASASVTIIFYEAPHRLLSCLEDLQTIFGVSRQMVVARELTKKFEQIYRGSPIELLNYFQNHAEECRGEIVVLIAGIEDAGPTEIDPRARNMLKVLCEAMPQSQAVALLSRMLNINKNKLYALALKWDE